MSEKQQDPDKNAVLIMLEAMIIQERKFDLVVAELFQATQELNYIKGVILQLADQYRPDRGGEW